MSVYLENAKNLLNQVQNDNPALKQAYEDLNTVTKEGGISDLVNNPKFQNIINLLTPFVVNYKVNQVIKLLKDLEQEGRPGRKWWL